MPETTQLISKPALARRWEKTGRTLDRWTAHPPPGFPGHLILSGRKMWKLHEIEDYERRCAATRSPTDII